jgi:hypothetical protein
MAKKRGGKQSPERYVAGMVELIGALSNIRNGGNGHVVPLTDPSINVDRQLGQAVQRLDDVSALQFRYTTDMANLRARHQAEMSTKETERLDAIRQVDTGAVAQAAQVQAAQATTLAATQATIADTLRGQVSAAATATATALATALAPIITSIESLRQAQYQQQGERTQRSEGTATYRWVVPTAIAGAGCFVAVFGLIVTIITAALTAAWLHSLHVF